MKITATDLSSTEAKKIYQAVEELQLDYTLTGVYNPDKRRLNLYLTPFDADHQ